MRAIFFISLFLLLCSCSNQKKVYWCGDHVCLNNKERTLYFQKTMTVELKKTDYVENKNITDHAIKMFNKEKNVGKKSKDNKELSKQILLEEKNRIKEEKKLAKKKLLEEKNRIKEEKKLAKKKLLEEKNRIKQEKKLAKKVKKNKSEDSLFIEIDSSNNDFSKILEMVTNKNMFRPFPDINDIPE